MNAENTEPETTDGAAPSMVKPALTGWAALENFLKDLDNGMVNNFNDDINTLLTFAGLFSAVLTAFVIETYKSLQADSTDTTSHILLHISQQLANSSLPPFTSEAFQPQATTVTINTLWFLSLVLSLASALFGMLAKQWLREYMQWSTIPLDAETSILLRQHRYDSFRRWKTAAIIAIIPVLLELALLLFLLGTASLLWTLNTVVAWVCSVATALLISAFLTSIILPAIIHHCPYKTPSGWICLRVGWSLGNISTRMRGAVARWRAKGYSGALVPVSARKPADWRQLDLQEYRPEFDPIADNDLSAERPSSSHIREVKRIHVLLGTLAWVRETSEDLHLQAAVRECSYLQSSKLHPIELLAADAEVARKVWGLVVTRAVSNDPTAQSYDISDHIIRLNPRNVTFSQKSEMEVICAWQHETSSVLRHQFKLLLSYRRTTSTIHVQILESLFLDLIRALDTSLAGQAERSPRGPEDSESDSGRVETLVHAVMDGASLAVICASLHRAVPTDSHLSCQTLLRRLVQGFHKVHHDRHLHARFPVLWKMLFVFVNYAEESLDTALIAPPAQRHVAYANLALQVLYGDSDRWKRSQCDLFLCMSSAAIRHALHRDHPRSLLSQISSESSSMPMDELLRGVEACATLAQLRRWQNCGSYTDLGDWYRGLLLLTRDLAGGNRDQAEIKALRGSLSRALTALDACQEQQLLVGGTQLYSTYSTLIQVVQAVWWNAADALYTSSELSTPERDVVPLSTVAFVASETPPRSGLPDLVICQDLLGTILLWQYTLDARIADVPEILVLRVVSASPRTPLAGVIYDEDQEMRVFTINNEAVLQEHICVAEGITGVTRWSQRRGSLHTWKIKIAANNFLAAVISSKCVHLFYQDFISCNVNEVVLDSERRYWSSPRTLNVEDPMLGTPLAAMAYRSHGVARIRLYYQTKDFVLRELCLNDPLEGRLVDVFRVNTAYRPTFLLAYTELAEYDVDDRDLFVYWVRADGGVDCRRNEPKVGWHSKCTALKVLPYVVYFAAVERNRLRSHGPDHEPGSQRLSPADGGALEDCIARR